MRESCFVVGFSVPQESVRVRLVRQGCVCVNPRVQGPYLFYLLLPTFLRKYLIRVQIRRGVRRDGGSTKLPQAWDTESAEYLQFLRF